MTAAKILKLCKFVIKSKICISRYCLGIKSCKLGVVLPNITFSAKINNCVASKQMEIIL